MAGNLNIGLIPGTVSFSPSSESRRLFLYVDKKITSSPKLDAKGRALYKFTAGVALNGVRIGDVSIETPQLLPEMVPLGMVLTGAGDFAELRVRNQRDAFDLSVTVFLDSFSSATK
ncbi:hypothetical protein [Subtercola sp. RTI3]|uniref:hypothetical protein n=1 Tax=Subtercola sp. RTI3 TaxID=3048639 RepID=UPI002B23BA04|nr:hypothetical protein [Subtercola sp. RTI3]MEA9984940.1 hypothetical protein [Subtercola sp. RTI3]